METISALMGRVVPVQSRSEAVSAEPVGQRAIPSVPKKFLDVRFGTSEDRGPHWRRAKAAVLKWIEDTVAGGAPKLALVGPTGTGKSHLLYCAAWNLWEEHERFPAIFRWYEVVDDLRDLSIARQTRQRIRDAKILMLDECRPTSGTDFDALELAKISFAAYDNEQPVLLSCNWGSLAELMGEPAADRYTVVTIVGASARSG